MESVLNNPYRILGLLSNSTAKEQSKQIKRLKQFIEAEILPDEDFSFPTIGRLDRTTENIDEAVSKINLDQDKMLSSLFWFYNGNSITDEAAFEAIKDSNLKEAINIWEKHTDNNEVSSRNSSAFSNLSTFYLSGILDGTDTEFNLLKKGIDFKLKFIQSDYVKIFKEQVTDQTYKVTKKEIQLLFLNQIIIEIEKKKTISVIRLIELLNNIEFTAKDEFVNSFIQKPIELIDKKIDEVKIKRKENKQNSLKYGRELFDQTNQALLELKTILGVSNIKYITISDKLANEILQCSIEYYNDCFDNNTNSTYVIQSLEIAKLAESIVIGNLTKERVKETIETYESRKNVEYNKAIALLRDLSNAFDDNKDKILKEVRSMQLGFRQTINWTKVNEAIDNSLDWVKVTSLLLEKIPQENIHKIKDIEDEEKIKEFKKLMNFIYGKLNYSQKKQVKYILYWDKSPTLPSGTDVNNIPTSVLYIGVFILFLIFMKACN